MARKRSSLRKTSWFTTIFRMALLAVTGGGVGGYFKPSLPIVGPLVQGILGGNAEKQISSIVDQVIGGDPKSSLATGSAANGSTASGPIENPATQYVPVSHPSTNNVPAVLTSSRRPSDRMLIGTFNIQVFGESKINKPDVVGVLAEVVRQFDILAIQEIRAQSDDILPEFLKAINADGNRYAFLIGERIGRTVSTEQYAYIYDTTRVEHDPNAYGTMTDANDLLHREPFVARFRARTSSPQNAFTFWLVDIHTDPDEVAEEVEALAEVFKVMAAARSDEDDVILLGDLNASESQLGSLGKIPGMNWVVRDAMTNTRQNKAYDNILFLSQATSEYTGRWGVMNIEQMFGLSREQAIDVSDHLPVWAEFSVWETPHLNEMAGREPALR